MTPSTTSRASSRTFSVLSRAFSRVSCRTSSRLRATPAGAARAAACGLLVAAVVLAGAACSSETSVSSGPGSSRGTGSTDVSTPPSPPGTAPRGTAGSSPTSAPRTPTTAPTTGATTGPTTTFVASPPPVAPTTDDGAVYLALIRHSLDRTKLDPPNGSTPYGEIVIVDHGVAGAAEPTATGSTADGPAFSEGVRSDLVDGLRDLGPVRFAANAKSAAVTSGPGRENVLVIVGPIEKVGSDGRTVHVGMSKTCGPMCGSGGTSILERRDTGWQVTGATGGGWIS